MPRRKPDSADTGTPDDPHPSPIQPRRSPYPPCHDRGGSAKKRTADVLLSFSRPRSSSAMLVAIHPHPHPILHPLEACQPVLALAGIGVLQHHRRHPSPPAWDQRQVSVQLIPDARLLNGALDAKHLLNLVAVDQPLHGRSLYAQRSIHDGGTWDVAVRIPPGSSSSRG